ncbi:MAG: hypothetical protein HUJ73_00350 [Eubacterium sp.]|nr:hypothetical protein [Eubacterium sp.]
MTKDAAVQNNGTLPGQETDGNSRRNGSASCQNSSAGGSAEGKFAGIKKAAETLLHWRWLIAGIIFAVCVLFRLHGSAIAVYDEYLPTVISEEEAEDHLITGQARPIRSDEWAVHTPTYFSQTYNDFGKYSSQKGIGDMNMILDYYAPSLDITLIGRPLNLGYILFGNEVGLSWYWCGLQILLFMTALEMLLILTKRNLIASAAGMLMIGFSPVMQWWLIPHITIVFVYAMGLFAAVYYIFTAKERWKQWLVTFLSVVAASGFALSLFPSCQIISGLVILALLVLCLIRDKDEVVLNKGTLIRLIVALLCTGGILGEFVLTSREDLKLLMNTVYPGKRISTGGTNTFSQIFTNLGSIALPYKDVTVSNNCEVSSFIHFGPLFLVLFPKLAICLKKKGDRQLYVGIGFVVILLIQIFFMCVGFPEWLARLTMFKYVNRMIISYGWTATLFSVWFIRTAWAHKGLFRRWEAVLYAAVYGVVSFLLITDELHAYLAYRFLIPEIAVLCLMVILALRGRKVLFALIMGVFMVIAGFPVNPICRGIAPITNHPISAYIASSLEEENGDALWITVNTHFIIANFAAANGARVFNATNFYPDYDKWELIDPERKYDNVYNRYAQCLVSFTDEETYLEETGSADLISLFLNPKDLETLGIRYIIGAGDVDDVLDEYKIRYTEEMDQDGYRVYKLEWA